MSRVAHFKLRLLDFGNLGAPLKEVSGENHGIREELSIVLDLLDSLQVFNGILGGLEVGIARALIDSVADFFTAEASHILELFLLFLLSIRISGLILIVILALVLADFAAISLLGSLSAAPPHLGLTAPLGLMSLARPVKVLFFKVLPRALLADLLVIFDPEPLILDSLDTLSELKVFIHKKFGALEILFEVPLQLGDLNDLLLELNVEFGFCRGELLLLVLVNVHLGLEDVGHREQILARLVELLLRQVLQTLQTLLLLDKLIHTLLLHDLLELLRVVLVLIAEEILHGVVEELELFLDDLELDLVELFGLADLGQGVAQCLLVDVGFPELLRIVLS